MPDSATPREPHLRLPEDYLYNPLYFASRQSTVARNGVKRDVAPASPQRSSHVVLPSSTYLHRSLHFELLSPSSSTPVRSHHRRTSSRGSRLTDSSMGAPHIAASTPRKMYSSSVAATNTSLLRRGKVLALEVEEWQRSSEIKHSEEVPVAAPSRETRLHHTNAELEASSAEVSSAAQLPSEHLSNTFEKMDETVPNLFFHYQRHPLQIAELCSPQRQCRTSSASDFPSRCFTPARQHNRRSSYSRVPRLTKAAQLRQKAAAERVAAHERVRSDMAEVEDLGVKPRAPASLQSTDPPKSATRARPFLNAIATGDHGSSCDGSTTTLSKGTYTSHHMTPNCTSRSEALADAINGHSETVVSVVASASACSDRSDMLGAAASTSPKDQGRRVDGPEHVGEATHLRSGDLVVGIPMLLSSLERRCDRKSRETFDLISSAAGDANLSEAVTDAHRPVPHDHSEGGLSHHNSQRLSSASQRHGERFLHSAADDLQGVVLRNSAAVVASSFLPAVPEAPDRPFAVPAEAALSTLDDGDAHTTSSRDLAVLKGFPSRSFPLTQRAASSSSESSIFFTVSSAPRGFIAGTGRLERQQSSDRVSIRATELNESCDHADDIALQLQRADQHNSDASERCSTIQARADSTSSSTRHADSSSSVAPPVLAHFTSSTEARAFITHDGEITPEIHSAVLCEESEEASSVERGLEETLQPREEVLRGRTVLLSADSSSVSAHAPDTSSVELAENAHLASRLLFEDSSIAGPPSQCLKWVEAQGQVASTLVAAEEEEQGQGQPSQHHSRVSSSQSSFLSIASYCSPNMEGVCSTGYENEKGPSELSAREALSVDWRRSLGCAPEVVKGHVRGSAEHILAGAANARPSRSREVASAMDDAEIFQGQDGLLHSSSRLHRGFPGDSPSSMSGRVIAEELEKGYLSNKGPTDLSRTMDRGEAGTIDSWGLPLPLANITHVIAAWEAFEQGAITAVAHHLLSNQEPPRGRLDGRVSARKVERPKASLDNSLLPYQPRMEGPVWKEPLDSLRLPKLQERNSCGCEVPRAADTPAGTVDTALGNTTRDIDPGEEVVDGVFVFTGGRGFNAVSHTAAAVDPGAVVGADRTPDTNSLCIQSEGAKYRDTGITLVTSVIQQQTPSAVDAAPQTAATRDAMSEVTPEDRISRSRLLRPRQSGFLMNRSQRMGKKVSECLSLMSDNAPSQPHASRHQCEQESRDCATDGTEVLPRPAVSYPSPSPPKVLTQKREAGLGYSESSIILCDAGKSSSGTREAKASAAVYTPKKSVQRTDGDSTRFCSASPGARSADSIHFVKTFRLSTSRSLSTQSRTPESVSFPVSVAVGEIDFFSFQQAEPDRSPLELSTPAWRETSLGNGGGEEDISDGVPHSHAPTPLSCQMPQRKIAETTLGEAEQSPAAASEEGHADDPPPADTFSRTRVLARSLSAAAIDSHAVPSQLENAGGAVGETQLAPFARSVNLFFLPERGSPREGRVGGIVKEIAAGQTIPPTADRPGDQAAVPAEYNCNSPPRSLSSSKSCNSRTPTRNLSLPSFHAGSAHSSPRGKSGTDDGRALPHFFSSVSSSLITTPPAAPTNNSFLVYTPRNFGAPQQSGEGMTVRELKIEDEFDGPLTRDAMVTEPNATSISPPRDPLQLDTPLHHTKENSTEVEVFPSLYQPPPSEFTSDLETTHSEPSEHIAWSAGTWVDPARTSASLEFAAAGDLESALGAVHGLTRSAPTVSLTRVRYVSHDF